MASPAASSSQCTVLEMLSPPRRYGVVGADCAGYLSPSQPAVPTDLQPYASRARRIVPHDALSPLPATTACALDFARASPPTDGTTLVGGGQTLQEVPLIKPLEHFR